MAVSIDAQAAINEIAAELEQQSDADKFMENFSRTPATFDEKKTRETWDIFKQNAKDAGMSIMDWLNETAFEGSKNPQGIAQQALAGVSYPFRLANELTMDYLKSKPNPSLIDPVGGLLGVVSGGLGIPANKWATGEPVTKMDTGIAALTLLGGPMTAGALKGSGYLARRTAPKTTKAVDESIDLARRRLIKAGGATAVAVAGGVGGAFDALKVVAPVAKVSKAALAVSTITTGLATKVMRNLHTLIVQTPAGGYPKTAMDEAGNLVLPSKAMGDEVGDTVSTYMAKEIGTGENRHILSFVNRIFNKSDQISLPPRERNFEWKLLDDVDGYKDVTKVIGDEELDLVRINQRLAETEHLVPDVARSLNPDVAKHMDDVDYANYHMVKSADVSSSTIRFEEGLSVIDDLAKNNPAELVRILGEVIDEAETLLAFGAKNAGKDVDHFVAITKSGNPMHIFVADEKATIKMAREILEALK